MRFENGKSSKARGHRRTARGQQCDGVKGALRPEGRQRGDAEKIIRLADELGYRQPSARRREADGGSCSIGVLISERYLDKYDSFYRLICQQVATEAVRQECFTMMEPMEHEAEDQPALPRLVQEQRVDGLLVIGRLAEGYRSLRWRDMITSSIRDSATCPLTTCEVDTKEMACRGVRMLTGKIAGKDYRQGISIVEGHMVIKDSVRRIAEGL